MNKKGCFGATLSVIGIIIVIGIICIGIFGLDIKTTENGKHTGYVTAIETNGIIFKTHSVYFKTDAESTQEDRYCILNETLKNELEQYQKDKKLVTISYYDIFSYGVKNCKINDIAIINKVEINN